MKKKLLILILFVCVLSLLSGCSLFGKVTVKFYVDSKTGQVIEDKEVASNTVIEEPVLNVEEREGTVCKVAGWYTDYQKTQKWDFSQPVKSDLNLYALWQPVDMSFVTLHYGDGQTDLIAVVNGAYLSNSELQEKVRQTLKLQNMPFVGMILYDNNTYTQQFSGRYVQTNFDLYVKFRFDYQSFYWVNKSLTVFDDEPFDPTEIAFVVNFDSISATVNYDSNYAFLWNIEMPSNMESEGTYNINVSFCGLSDRITVNRLNVRAVDLKIENYPSELKYYYKTVPDYSQWLFTVSFNNGTEIAVDYTHISINMPEITKEGVYNITFVSDCYHISENLEVIFFKEQVGDFYNHINFQGTIMLTGLTDSGKVQKELVVPETIDGLPVETIDDGAFADTQSLETVYLPSSLKNLGNGVFQGCTALYKVGLSGDKIGLTSFGEKSFSGCSNLREIEFWGQITEVGDSAFENCEKFFPDLTNVKVVGTRAFWGCNSVSRLDVSKFTYIGDYAFANIINSELQLTIQYLTADINETTFENSTIKQLNLDTVSDLEGKISFLKTVPYISTWCISGDVPAEFLKDNVYIEKLYLNSGSIDDYAFAGCLQLSEVYYTKVSYAIRVGNGAFSGCSNLTIFTIDGDQTQNTFSQFSIESEAFYGCAFENIYFYQTYFESNSFANNIGLKEVIFDESTALDNAYNVFANCTSLTKVSGTLTKIAEGMFIHCIGLSNYELKAVEYIGGRAFYGTAIESFVVNATITSLATNAFEGLQLTSIEVDVANPNFELYAGLLIDKAHTTVYKAPKAIKSEKIELFDTVEYIAPGAFEGVETNTTLLIYRYTPPTAGHEWNLNSNIAIECNPFNIEEYEQTFANCAVSPIDSSVYYCITFDPRTSIDAIKSYLIIKGTQIGAGNFPVPTEESYRDITDDVNSTTYIQFPYTPTGNMLLTVGNAWKIQYNLGEGEVLPASTPVWVKENVEKVDLVPPVKENYVFDGWKLPSGEIVTELSYRDFQGDIVLQATWKPQYNITYVSQQEMINNSGNPKFIREGEVVTLYSPNSTSYNKFVGWKLNGEIVTDLTFEQLSGDIELEAEWILRRRIVYTVDEDVDFSVTSELLYVVYGEVLQLPTPSKENCQFAGWQLADGSIVAKLTYDMFNEDTVQLTAVWTQEKQ